MRQWRLIYDPPTRGALNMARDEAILSAVERGDSPPTLRLYAWQPACLSLGYGQRAREADINRLAALGWDVVRRPTGGRAILHVDELTYSLSLPLSDPIAEGGIIDSYQRLSGAILAALQSLGARVHAQKQESAGELTPVCFDTPSHYEITADGRKLVGSAQLRRRNALLQHGSLPLVGDIGRICDVLNYSDPNVRSAARAHVYARAVVLHDVIGHVVNWDQAAHTLADAFAAAFDIVWIVGELSSVERDEAAVLEAQKYANLAWTHKR